MSKSGERRNKAWSPRAPFVNLYRTAVTPTILNSMTNESRPEAGQIESDVVSQKEADGGGCLSKSTSRSNQDRFCPI
jgi:hypothetical protein